MTPAPAVVAGRYALGERIAVGGMGEVWRARDTVLERAVAVKLLRPEQAADPESRARLRDEARHAAGLSHAGIASVYDFGEDPGGACWLVMELVEGQPLSELLARDGPLPVPRTLDVVRQAALALQAAHAAGVVHRDVKPGNLIVRADGVVKVTDFGVADLSTSGVERTATDVGLVVGTAGYLSPEQAAGQAATPASDVYALGIVAYECLTGRRPFDGPDAAAVARAHLTQPPPPLPATVPEPVRDLVAATLEKDPARRPASAGELAEELAAAAVTLRRGRATLRTPRAHLHRRGLRLALPLLVLVVLALVARAVLGGGGGPSEVPSPSPSAVPASPRQGLPSGSVVPRDEQGSAGGTAGGTVGDMAEGTAR